MESIRDTRMKNTVCSNLGSSLRNNVDAMVTDESLWNSYCDVRKTSRIFYSVTLQILPCTRTYMQADQLLHLKHPNYNFFLI